jgi:hypothetical protein
VLYKKIQFSITDFRGMMHGLMTETRRLLQKKLILTPNEKLPAIL